MVEEVILVLERPEKILSEGTLEKILKEVNEETKKIKPYPRVKVIIK